MLLQSPLLLHLTSSFLISTLRIHVEPEDATSVNGDDVQTPLILISPNRNMSLTFRGNAMLVDNLPLAGSGGLYTLKGPFAISANCQHGFSFKVSVDDAERVLASPSFCTNHGLNKILIGPDDRTDELFYGCIHNITFGPNKILDRWCRLKNKRSIHEETVDKISSLPKNIQPAYIGEPLSCREGSDVKILWKNIYIFPDHHRFDLNYGDIHFKVIHAPAYGRLLVGDTTVLEFTYEDIINQSLKYANDGSENAEDSFEVSVWIQTEANRTSTEPKLLTMPINIIPEDDQTQIEVTPEAENIIVTPSTKTLLNERFLKIWDLDTPTDKLWLDVVEEKNAHLVDRDGNDIKQFTLAEFLRNGIYIEAEEEQGYIKISTRDSLPKQVALKIRSSPLEFRLDTNTGLRLPFRSSRLITADNLTARANFPVSLGYSVVDNPEFGFIECLKPLPTGGLEEFQLCSQFTQMDLEKMRVRFRHSSDNRPSRDGFAFRVVHGSQQSELFEFLIEFFPISVKVYYQEPIVLNNTEEVVLSRNNLMAVSFPELIQPDDFIYHIVEPPKYGMLSRQVSNLKMRRIGLASNFTQYNIDHLTIVYKLNYVQYNVVNDFFMFRILTPTTTTELLRCDITFLPGENSFQLINRTILVNEGRKQKITNNTLWLETPDEKAFKFIVIIPPFYGNFVLIDKFGIREILDQNDDFNSIDITNKKLSYEHSGSKSLTDRTFLRAESLHNTVPNFSFWLNIRIIPLNTQKPRLTGAYATADRILTIYVSEGGERTLHPSLFPWTDPDSKTLKSDVHFFFPNLFKDFTICRNQFPEIPVRNFTLADLQRNSLILRHVSLKTEASPSYIASDGKFEVESTVKFIAAKNPFMKILCSNIPTISPLTQTSVILVDPKNLWTDTNLDLDPWTLIYFFNDEGENPFKILRDGKLVSTFKFSQEDVSFLRVFFLPQLEPSVIKMKVEGGGLVKEFDLTVAPNEPSSQNPFQIHIFDHITLPLGAVFSLDTNVINFDGSFSKSSISIHEAARYGRVVSTIKSSAGSETVSVDIDHFSKIDLQNGLISYVHNGVLNEAELDYLTFNISIDAFDSVGPFKLQFNIVDSSRPVLIVLKNVSLPWGDSITINNSHIRALVPNAQYENDETIRFEVAERPAVGRLLVESLDLNPVNPSFTQQQLRTGRVYFTASSGDDFKLKDYPTQTSITLRACKASCSNPQKITINVEADNIQKPELLRNEPLQTAEPVTIITSRHLHAADSDTSPKNLKYLVWQPAGGRVARINRQTESISSFSQEEINNRDVVFVIDGDDQEKTGFAFILTDGLYQSPPEWFSVIRKAESEIHLENNVRLNVAPGQKVLIGPDLLKARILKVPSDKVMYHVSRMPTLGKLVLKNLQRPVEYFTQADVDEDRLYFQSHTAELGLWTSRDYFGFTVYKRGNASESITIPRENEFRFKITVSYSYLPETELENFVQRNVINLTQDSEVLINSTHINLEKLENYCNDVLVLEIERQPTLGELEILKSHQRQDDEENEEIYELTAQKLHGGQRLMYKHNKQTGNDEFVISVYGQRERAKKADKLKIKVKLRISKRVDLDIQIKRFSSHVSVVSGGSTTLTPEQLLIDNLSIPGGDLVYHVVKQPANGVKVRLNSTAEVKEFRQDQINAGLVRLEHSPLAADDRFDVLMLEMGGQSRVMVIEIEPLALDLFNHSVVSYLQGNTYVLLDRRHLGAISNIPASKIYYNVTEPPKNGSLYWVAGETTATVFTQKNINDGDILYAQLNMNAYEDSFRFTLSNEEVELMPKVCKIKVDADIVLQELQVAPLSVNQIADVHLNASTLKGRTPRYLVIESPKYGNFFLYPKTNNTVTFFTQSNINEGRLFYRTDVFDGPLDDVILFELRSDDVQPARFNWTIRITSSTGQAGIAYTAGNKVLVKTPKLDKTNNSSQLDLNYRFPVLILLAIVAGVIGFLLCRKTDHEAEKRKSIVSGDAIPNIGTRELPDPDDDTPKLKKGRSEVLRPGPARPGNDLLGQTVYVDQKKPNPHQTMEQKEGTLTRNLTTFDQSHIPRKAPFGPAYKSTALSAIARAVEEGSPSGKQPPTSRLNDNQYWV
ncbi:unnamed protein product [Bursaphelenchus xylophilus]|uniref:(pine wood nematode) hypothetical protein n=1 Tax=Bursaphelenchus xylophilus TaxID=6326 RepID=A0A1I7RYD7_BURXY|nr:unnamed protein product [Bursaphelenchus xylophilus]CAG9085637.1 unnamed protein product [Bursaphelenchus xylophilus]